MRKASAVSESNASDAEDGGRKGFTLFELAVAMLVLSLVAALWLPSRLAKTRIASAERLAAELNWTLEAARRYYWSDVGKRNFPSVWSDLTTNGFLPKAPQDPFGGTVSISANNTAVPKRLVITISGGIARYKEAGAVLARVPFAVLDRSASPPRIVVTMTEATIFPVKDEEIMFAGVVPSGTTLTKRSCPVRGAWEAYVTPVMFASSDGYPIQGVRAWYESLNDTSYRVWCEVATALGNGTDCYVAVYEICP
ncbi:Tfp pilus assembly protein FimT/FimU [Thermosulfurimonas sp. F29]|uniref:pilus assembly FimT family protein n=1 Tax=Thermosulfurimonas sp. F29 TaxID=2867247 RepID=UPI001C83CCE6|nr:type II secretion system protein [Thermosulfurimonas sp. F29]MBX6423406.1 type II secretion system GspH family protein [Thermosulfurimonas sp. F29]